ERERRTLAESAEARLQQALREFAEGLAASRGSERAPRISRGQADLLQRTLDEMHRELGMSAEPAPGGERGPARTLREGELVRVLSLGQEGSVIADNGESVLVVIGPMKMMLPKNDLRAIAAAPKRAQPQHDEG